MTMRGITTPATALLLALALAATSSAPGGAAFSPPPAWTERSAASASSGTAAAPRGPASILRSSSGGRDDDPALAEKFGGYTVKQRLREEVESPFRKVRLAFFVASMGSASIALYFSLLTTVKAYAGTYADAPPLPTALTDVAINLAGVVGFALLAVNDYRRGQANLNRISRGGMLARLAVSPAGGGIGAKAATDEAGAGGRGEGSGVGRRVARRRVALRDYRRTSRVVLCAGGEGYISELARSLNSDQRSDANTLPEAIAAVDVVIVPILLGGDDAVGDARRCWEGTVPAESDRNFDITRSDGVVAFPVAGGADWAEYLKDDLDTMRAQGFDVMEKGFTITVKKNGRILRRATGQPNWGGLIGSMEVMDGSKFGMPGDSEKYGGP